MTVAATALHALVFGTHTHYCMLCKFTFGCSDRDDDNPAPSFKDDDK